MNDRMYELINQCFIGTTDGKLSELNTVSNIEKFAELIVRECLAQARSEEDRFYGLGASDLALTMEHFQEVLKAHFGVEE